MATRINKYLSEVGYCSRRVADRLIKEGSSGRGLGGGKRKRKKKTKKRRRRR